MKSFDLPDPSNIHDTYFKALFQNPKNVRDFLEVFFPELSKYLKIESVEPKPTEKYSQTLGEQQYLDFAVNCDVKGRQLQVYLIFEHKSRVDRGIFLQLLRYMLCVWEEDLKSRRDLTPIIPIVFYHGRRKWSVRRRLGEYFQELPPDLARYVLDMEYLLFDTNQLEDEWVQRLISRNRILLVGIDVLREIYRGAEKSQVERVVDELADLIEEHREEFYEDVVFMAQLTIMYIQNVLSLESKEVNEMLQARRGKKIQYVFEYWMEQGMERGIQQGMERGLLFEAQESVLEALSERFGDVSQDIKDRVQAIQDRGVLKGLLRRAIRVANLDEFLQALKGMEN